MSNLQPLKLTVTTERWQPRLTLLTCDTRHIACALKKQVKAKPNGSRYEPPYLSMRIITMRQIKFRTYVRFLREMHEVREMIVDKGIVMIDAYQYWLDRDDAPVMQFTGLTDKNGVEIYEGDIVKKNDDKFVKVGAVSFIHGCWMVASKSGEQYFNLHWHLSQVEVIGNVHQNPELLEGDK